MNDSSFIGMYIGYITALLAAVVFAIVIYLGNKSERENNKKN